MNGYDKLLARLQAAVAGARGAPRQTRRRQQKVDAPPTKQPAPRRRKAKHPRPAKAHASPKHRKGGGR